MYWTNLKLKNIEKWDNFLQSGKNHGSLNTLEKMGNFAKNT